MANKMYTPCAASSDTGIQSGTAAWVAFSESGKVSIESGKLLSSRLWFEPPLIP